jgi:DNA glycosylase AlkZ-like
VTTVLGTRALNRALLARQHLLARSSTPPLAVVEHLVALQAQNPHDPYLGLWSRVAGFDATVVSDALADGRVVRIGLLRTTLHLATAGDARSLWPLVRPVFERAWSHSPFRRDLPGIDVDDILDAARPMLDETLTLAELGRRLETRWPGRPASSLSYAARFLLPIVQVPPRGLWGRSGQARWRHLDSWTGVAGGERPDGTSVADLVLRYLAAFGPATAADLATWSWLTGFREVLDTLGPRLRTYRDEAGRELFDLPDAPLPHPDTVAPFRFLPEYDNVALSHADRSRIVAPESVGRITGYVGTFLVDGFVAGQWRIARDDGAAALVLDPFVPLSAPQRDDALAEGAALLRFREPAAERHEVTFGVARATRAG